MEKFITAIGAVNPSGKTVDTWARDFKTDPTWNNFAFSGENGNVYTNLSNRYVIYKEGIYIGYRYYETRGFVEGTGAYTADGAANPAINGTTTTAWDSWYDAHVVYPFGYGLSYTTFSQEIVDTDVPANSALTADSEITVSVRVSNTGEVAGKQTALLFYTAPYDSVSATAIEKSHVVLGGFAKTRLLEPGESQVLEITVKARDMASYDYSDANQNGFKGYELEAGTYELKLMQDAHTVLDSVSYTVSQDIRFECSAATGEPIVNQFDEVSNYLTDSTSQGGLGEQYMSRRNFAGTFPTPTGKLSVSSALQAKIAEWSPGKQLNYAEQEYYVPEDQMPTFGDDSGPIQLADLFGADYDDPMWDEFLNQISKDTLCALVCEGGYRSGVERSGLGIPRVINAGQPAGYMSLFSGMEGAQYAFFASDVVTASTYNVELCERKGNAIGNEALFGTGKEGSRFLGWYAPSADTHRSPFGGRNADYYSEDGFLAGKMASGIIRGAMEKGVYAYCKHFALNEQETNRDSTGLITWANEQAMREMYFQPFERVVKEGGTTAIMSSFNRLGSTWAGENYALLTGVLRNEWGFQGMVITDYNLKPYMNPDQMIRAGGDLSLSPGGKNFTADDAATSVSSLRRATKNVLYSVVNSNAMNGLGEGIVFQYKKSYWEIVLISIDCVLFVSLTVWGVIVMSNWSRCKRKLAKEGKNAESCEKKK